MAAKADAVAKSDAKMDFGKLLAEARLGQPCSGCGADVQSGLLACPTCKGTGKVTKTRIDTLTEKDPKTGVERRRTSPVEYQDPCPTCRGFTTIPCPVCHGAGVDLGMVGAVEKPWVIDGLKRRMEWLVRAGDAVCGGAVVAAPGEPGGDPPERGAAAVLHAAIHAT